MSIISAEQISFYDQLKESNFNINSGFTTLMGPSGSGKSTCAQLLLGALKITSGKIRHFSKDGSEVLTVFPENTHNLLNKLRLESDQNRRIKKHVIQSYGYVAQTPELPKDMTVRDYIYNVRTAAGNRLDLSYVEGLLERLGIHKNIDSIASAQSGGEQQRTALAFALANRPNFLIADEPNASLDSVSGKEVLNLTRSLADEGMSVLWITHTAEHQEYADHRLIAKDGVITEEAL